MVFSYEISKLALKDLDSIWLYTSDQWSKQQANKYFREIFQSIDHICKNAEMGKPIDEVKKGHRRLNVKSHMIIYKITEKKNFIDRILHQQMDIDQHLHE